MGTNVAITPFRALCETRCSRSIEKKCQSCYHEAASGIRKIERQATEGVPYSKEWLVSSESALVICALMPELISAVPMDAKGPHCEVSHSLNAPKRKFLQIVHYTKVALSTLTEYSSIS